MAVDFIMHGRTAGFSMIRLLDSSLKIVLGMSGYLEDGRKKRDMKRELRYCLILFESVNVT